MEQGLTPSERERGRSLHHRSALGETLTDDESAALTAFYEAMEREEAVALAPGVQRQEARLLWLQTRRRELEEVVDRQEAFKKRLERLLSEAQAERQTIAQDYRRILQTPEPVL